MLFIFFQTCMFYYFVSLSFKFILRMSTVPCVCYITYNYLSCGYNCPSSECWYHILFIVLFIFPCYQYGLVRLVREILQRKQYICLPWKQIRISRWVLLTSDVNIGTFCIKQLTLCVSEVFFFVYFVFDTFAPYFK